MIPANSSCSRAPEDDPAWQQWGPYMSNREWGTVRETDSPDGCNWTRLPYPKAADTAYRFAEDGIFGVCDRDCQVCHAYAFWNYRDGHLKERFFGVGNDQGVHGEDVKEVFHYKAADSNYSYICAEYLYPQIEYPYKHLVELENSLKLASNTDQKSEFADLSLTDFNSWHKEEKYFEIEFEMTKVTPDQLFFQLSITNCSSEAARIVAMPMLFLRNTWSAGWRTSEDAKVSKVICVDDNHLMVSFKDADGVETTFGYYYDSAAAKPEIMLTDNNSRDPTHSHTHFKDSFNRYVINGDGTELIGTLGGMATKAGICYRLKLAPKQQVMLRAFLMPQKWGQSAKLNWQGLTSGMEMVRLNNLVDVYQSLPTSLVPVEQDILNAAYTTLLWNRQYYPLDRMPHLWEAQWELPTRLVTVPDKWEQPYLASWDTALHCLCLNPFDRRQALLELGLLLALIRPDGSMFTDEYSPLGVTPPLVVLAAIDVYRKCTLKEKLSLGSKIYSTLKNHLQWWLNRKDVRGDALIDGGVCGVDYVSLFPRECVEIGEGIIWATFFSMRFLELSLLIHQSCPKTPVAATIERDLPQLTSDLGRLCDTFVHSVTQHNGFYHPCWLDVAAAVSTAENFNNYRGVTVDWSDVELGTGSKGTSGHSNSPSSHDSVRSDDDNLKSFPGVAYGDDGDDGGGGVCGGDVMSDSIYGELFAIDGELHGAKKRSTWLHAYCYLPVICCCSLPNVLLSGEATGTSPANLEDLLAKSFYGTSAWQTRAPYIHSDNNHSRLFVSLIDSLHLAEMLEELLSEVQFLSQFGIRTMSMLHTNEAATARVTCGSCSGPRSCASCGGTMQKTLKQKFCPGASTGGAYGGNTNWFGAVNLPYNYLVLESLHTWSTVLDRKFDLIESHSYTGVYRRLKDIVQDLAARNVALFVPNANGIIPSTGDEAKRGLLMYETFNGDSGRGHGAQHKGGWSAIISRILLLMHGIE